jgi:hypothetical protein
MKVRSHLSVLVVLNEVTNYALDFQIKKRKSEAENTYSSLPNKAPEGATRTDSYRSTAPVQQGISVDPEQTNGDSSRRLPESESSASPGSCWEFTFNYPICPSYCTCLKSRIKLGRLEISCLKTRANLEGASDRAIHWQ